MRTKLTLVAFVSLLVGCGNSADQPSASPGDEPTANAAVDPAVYRNAVDTIERSEADRARDGGREPAHVMMFFDIRPGMRVLDLFSGGGYYSEILSRVVGDSGQVVAQTNEAYLGFVGDEFNARYANNRLPNVEILMAENNELTLDAGSFDAVMMVLSYHDLYYVAPDQGWPKIDPAQLLAELHKGLKPGGLLCIIDHYAAAGAPRETGGTLHRIDPAIVISEVEQAGFKLDASSDMLRNTADDHSKNVFDASIRGKTDRFVLRFRKL